MHLLLFWLNGLGFECDLLCLILFGRRNTPNWRAHAKLAHRTLIVYSPFHPNLGCSVNGLIPGSLIPCQLRYGLVWGKRNVPCCPVGWVWTRLDSRRAALSCGRLAERGTVPASPRRCGSSAAEHRSHLQRGSRSTEGCNSAPSHSDAQHSYTIQEKRMRFDCYLKSSATTSGSFPS